MRTHGVTTPLRTVEVATEIPPLRTPRMILRPLRATDREAYLAAARVSRQSLDRHLPLHMEGESDDRMFDRQLELARLTRGRDWLRFVGLLPDGQVAGGFNLNSISRGLEWRADINWWIATPLTGRGLATEAIRALIAHASTDLPVGLGLHELHAWITRDSAASKTIAHKLGFIRSGEERSYLLTDSRTWVLHDLWIRRLAGLTAKPRDGGDFPAPRPPPPG